MCFIGVSVKCGLAQKGFLFCLFLPVIRTVAPFLAGVTNMHFIKFVRSASLGAIIWVLVCVLAGYFFGNIAIIKNHLGLVTLVGLGFVIIAVTLKTLFSKLRKSH